MRDVRELWSAATRLYDDPALGLEVAAKAAAFRGVDAGAEWMRAAIGVVRGTPPSGRASFLRLAVVKYGLACLGAGLASLLVWSLPALVLPAALVAFYAAESRLVFVFPLALDGDRTPLTASGRLVARTQPPVVAALRVMTIAAGMVFGGFTGRGFLRSWCLGCLAVVLWYEDARRAAEVAA